MKSNTYALITSAKNGDKDAKELLVESNLGLVYSIVRKFSGRGYESDDLFQIGCIGLIKAIDKFDFSFNVQFSTYAVPVIIGEIKRFLRDDGIVKVSRSLKELSAKSCAVREKLMRQLGREPTITEIAENLNQPVEDVVMALEAAAPPQSIYAEPQDGGRQLLEMIDSGTDVEDNIVNKVALQQALGSFKARERQVIMLRYFSHKTQMQVAQMLGVSQVQVSRIEKKVLLEMREKLSDFKFN